MLDVHVDVTEYVKESGLVGKILNLYAHYVGVCVDDFEFSLSRRNDQELQLQVHFEPHERVRVRSMRINIQGRVVGLAIFQIFLTDENVTYFQQAGLLLQTGTDPVFTEDEKKICRALGKRLAEIAIKLK